MMTSASLATWIVKHCTSLPFVHPSRTTDRVIGGSTGSMGAGVGRAEGKRGEVEEAGDGMTGEVVFFFLQKNPMMLD